MSIQAPELEYDIQDWSAGFLDSPDATALPKGGTPKAANCLPILLKADGSCKLAKRTGAKLINPVAMQGLNRVDALHDFTRESGIVATQRDAGFDGQLLAMCNGVLHKWDGVETFNVIGALPGFGADEPVEFLSVRNLALIMNGVSNYAYDGTSILPVGFGGPNTPAVLTVGGAGVITGTYQSIATFYDKPHDHESSPSAASAQVVFAAQQRVHSQPGGGAYPPNVTHWRIYVRRIDTNETYYKLVGEPLISVPVFTEEVKDEARNLATNLLGPLPNSNDVPPAFAFAGYGLGYRFGVKADDSFVWVSALNDAQSQHPKDQIAINRGDGQPVTTVKSVGTTILVQKGTKSWYMQGDKMPFIPHELQGSYGNHSQSSSVEAANKYWGWDTDRGPYMASLDSNTWTSLADGRLEEAVKTINRTAEIRCVHYKDLTLVAWIVASGASLRKRTMLAWNYQINAWLPPIYGIEYASMTSFRTTTGAVNLYIGDEWGRVYQYFNGGVEGPPGGTLVAPVTFVNAGTFTLQSAGASFYNIADRLIGMPVAVVDPSGNWQIRTILNNNATDIVIDTTNGPDWETVPDGRYTIVVGGIDWYWCTALIDWGKPMRRKVGGYLYGVALAASAEGAGLVIRARLNDTSAISVSEAFKIRTSNVWGQGQWGKMMWGTSQRQIGRARFLRSFYAIQFELSNRYPNEPIDVLTFGVTADGMKGRWARV